MKQLSLFDEQPQVQESAIDLLPAEMREQVRIHQEAKCATR